MGRVLHIILVYLAIIPWMLAVTLGVLCLILVMLAEKAWPNATCGNCWSFVGPKWFKHGGYLGIRYADGIRIFGKLRVPHAIWIKSLGTADVEHTFPVHRSKAKYLPWRILYFPFLVKTKDSSHDAIS